MNKKQSSGSQAPKGSIRDLIKSEEMYRSLVESSDAAITMMEPDGTYIYLNDIASAPFGLPPEKMTGVNCKELFPPDQVASIMSDLEWILKNDHAKTTRVPLTLAGKEQWFRTSMTPVHDADGKAVAVMIHSANVTDIVNAEKYVAAAERKYEALFFDSPVAYILSEGEDIVECNKACQDILGGPKSQIIGRKVRDFSPEFQPDGTRSDIGIVEKINEIIKNGKAIFEWTHLRLDGSPFRALVSLSFMDLGGSNKIFATWQDLTLFKQAEEEIRRLSQAVEQSPISIVITDLKGNIKYANQAACKTTGYSLDELVGSNPKILKSGETSDSEYSKLWENISSGKEWKGVLHNKRKNGELYWEQSTIAPIVDKNGDITHYLAVKEDITERIKIQDALAVSENRFRQVASHSGTVVWETDNDGMYTYMSDSAGEVFGYEPGELVNKLHFYDIHPDEFREDFKREGLKLIQSGQDALNLDNPIKRKDGSTIWVSTSGTPLKDKDGNNIGYRGSDIDITARRSAEEEFRKFRTVADQAKYGVAIANLDDKLVYVNDAYAEMHGWTKNELLGKPTSTLYSNELWQKVAPSIKRVKDTRGSFTNEVIRTRRDGSLFPALLSINAIVDNKNEPLYTAATVVDFSDLKEKESMLQKLNIAISQSPVAIVMTDLDSMIQYVSPAFEKITGYQASEVIGKPTSILKSGTTPQEIYQDLWDTIKDGRSWKGEWHNKKKDGSLYCESISVTPVSAPYGRVTGYLAIKEDITERKKTEEALRESNAQFQELFEKTPISILIYDTETYELINANPTAMNFTGATSLQELQGLNRSDSAQFNNNIAREMISRTVENGPQQFEWQTKKKNGEMAWLGVRLNAVEIDGKKRVIVTGVDITDQKKSEEHRIARISAEHANKAKSTFLSNMSHEIRTPLNAIIGFAQILKRDKTLSPKQADQIDTILRSSEHLMKLINDILDLSRIEAGRLDVTLTDFNLHDLMNDVEMMFSLRAKDKGIGYSVKLDGTVPMHIVTDESKLRQVLINLIGNSFKFTENGSITVTVKAEESPGYYETKSTVDKSGLRLTVEVSDTGPGISDADKQRIFESFYQADVGAKAGGTGLGLAISKNLIELMGGKLTLESTLGKGSTFRFFIPAKMSEKTEHKPKLSKKVTGLEPGTGPFRVLVVDDMKDNRDMLSDLLISVGFEVREAENGLEAVQLFETWKPQCILMDMRMPVMNGFEATRKIKDMPGGKDTYIVAVTASSYDNDLKKVFVAGTDAYLSKPFKTEELFAILTRIPGLRYVFEEEGAENQKPAESGPITREEVLTMPADLRRSMFKAVEEGSMLKLRELISHSQELDPQTAKGLLNLARQYDYEKLGKLLSENGGGNG